VQTLQRKPKRLFAGLVGRYEPELAAAIVTPIERGPGQPRIHADNAAKQRAYRRRGEDSERRNLIAWILKKTWSTAVDARRNFAEREAQRKYRRKLHDELLTLSVNELHISVEILKRNLDLHGRLHNERSGERDRLNGMSEIERLLARKERSENQRKVSRKTPSILKAPRTDEKVNAAIRDLMEMFVDRKCPWCEAVFDLRSTAENHLQEEYDKGKRQAEHVKTLRAYESIPANLLEEAEGRLSEHTHYAVINDRVRRMCKRDQKWQRDGKQILDASKNHVGWDLRVW
jgi:hypothetical protein